MLEFREDPAGMVCDGSPLAGNYVLGDWWLDGEKVVFGDVLLCTEDGEEFHVTATVADYGYVRHLVLAAEVEEEEGELYLIEVDRSNADKLQVAWSERWFDGMTAMISPARSNRRSTKRPTYGRRPRGCGRPIRRPGRLSGMT